jgi:WD40 repeat protein
LEQTLTGHKLYVRSVAFSPDGRWLASGSNDNNIKVWDLASGKAKQELNGHLYDVESVAFSRDGQWIASGSGDHTIKLWGRFQ